MICPCYKTPMRNGTQTPLLPLTGAFLLALTAAGCGNRKAPPPIEPAPSPVTPAATAPATSAAAPSQPEPFSLKPGEQLVPHKVAKGESLWVLAQKYNTRVSRIKAANGMTSDMITEGKTLQIPTTGGGAGDPVAAPAPAAPAPAAVTPIPAPTAPAPNLFQPAPAPAPAAPAPAAPAQGAAPSLNFGNPAPAAPAPAAPAGGGIKIQDN